MSRLEELKQREEGAQAAPKRVDAQHKAGKKTARERISALLDAASFVEIDKFVRKGYVTPGYESTSEPGEGVVCGYGTVDDRPVFVFAQDFTILSGSVSAAHAQKILKVIDMASSMGVPVVGMLDSGGARVSEGVGAIDSYAAILKRLNDVSGAIPTIAVVAGPCIGTAAYIAAAADFCFAVDKITTLALHGPQIYSATLGGKFDAKEAFSAKASNETTGVAQFLCPSEDECVSSVKQLLGYLPGNSLEGAPFEQAQDDANRAIKGFDDAYDPRSLIANVVDDGVCLEYQALYAKEVTTAIGRMNGSPVAFVANDVDGVITGPAARKAARFVSLMDAYGIPIVTFTNCSGTPISVDDPNLIRDCAQLIAAYAEAGTAMVNLVVGEAIGDGYAIMCPKSIGADMVLAWPQAVLSAMPPEAGSLVMYEKDINEAKDAMAAKQEALEKYEKEYANPWKAAEQGVVDDIIEPENTRQMLISALQMCETKRAATGLPRKHSVLAL